MNNKNIKLVLGFSIAMLILLGALLLSHQPVVANGADTCPDGNGWTKIDSGDLSQYPVSGGKEYCFKAGNFLVSSIPDGGFGQEGACNADNIQNCGLSHWSYFIPETVPTEPSPEPTEPTVEPTEPTVEPTEPTIEPTEPPKQDFAILNLSGRCLGVVQEDVVVLSSATIEWTVSNFNNMTIHFSWQGNNGETGNGTAPANGSTTITTSGTGNSVNLTYNLGEDEIKSGLTVEVCEVPKEEPTDEPKSEPTDEPKDEPQVEPRVTVDAQPDQPAGGTGPAVLQILATLLVGGSTIGLASAIILKKKS